MSIAGAGREAHLSSITAFVASDEKSVSHSTNVELLSVTRLSRIVWMALDTESASSDWTIWVCEENGKLLFFCRVGCENRGDWVPVPHR